MFLVQNQGNQILELVQRSRWW